MSAEVLPIEVDTTPAQQELDQLQQHADITALSVISVTRKGYQSLALMADLFAIAIPEWFNLLAMGALMAGEMFAALAAAETVTGVLALKAVVTFSIATMMFYRAMQLRTAQSEVESKLNTMIQLINTWS